MKKVISLILVVLMLFSVASVSVVATDSDDTVTTTTQYFDDGSYMVVTVRTNEISTHAKSNGTADSTKDYNYYTSSGALRWTVTLTASFTYTGSSATCKSASVSHKIYNSAWSVKSENASRSGRTATATFTVVRTALGIVNKTVSDSITLSCSNAGVVS